MARRKSVCTKWTLVLLVFLVCPFVSSRPQETSSQAPSVSSTTNNVTDQPTENDIRYRHRKNNLSLNISRSNLPKVLHPIISSFNNDTKSNKSSVNNNKANTINVKQNDNSNINGSSRRARVISKSYMNRNNVRKANTPNLGHESEYTKRVEINPFSRKPAIRRVITKWTDKAKYEDLPFYQDTSSSTEQDLVTFTNSLNVNDDSSTESIVDQKPFNKSPPYRYSTIQHQNNYGNNRKPNPNQNKKHHGHTNKVHLIGYPFPSVRPSYIFTTPTPTPVITNVGNPMPWYPNPPINYPPSTRKPVLITKPIKDENNYHNSIHNHLQYNGDNFDVTTFPPAAAYTERIVIRPEEYSAMDECPTIYLTLNNTFQGQGKEACPDLNIAVNTNVVNKNIAVESEEDYETDGLFPGAFGALGDSDESLGVDATNEYTDSDETPDEVESASVESAEFAQFNQAPVPPAAPPAAPVAPVAPGGAGGGGGSGSPSSALTAGKPGHGNKDEDDDTFSISGLMSYFQPAVNAMTWLSGVNPLSFTMMSLFLTPLAMFFAAYSGVAALFAPLGLAREAPKVVHVYRPKWEWDDKYKTWFLNTHPNDRRWRPTGRFPKQNMEVQNQNGTVRETWFYKLKNWMKTATQMLRERSETLGQQNMVRKNKRKKRETWTRRIK